MIEHTHQALYPIREVASTFVANDSAAAAFANALDPLNIRYKSIRELVYDLQRAIAPRTKVGGI